MESMIAEFNADFVPDAARKIFMKTWSHIEYAITLSHYSHVCS